ncbi:CPBP family intramembrane metalloprotease [Clostridium sp. PL3]|uniref:CPBP family intramembrane metalloprotease n=1 Tax=Clostridium thailandense TaxID=2794346 RepID=A0A949TNE8_9CLOT|nr:type II CAAX endopeptidase family protein [Clostridium thailandense]MBV7272472.1 CPBP family intramembrane metalloprotease [Clostridium thailandense]
MRNFFENITIKKLVLVYFFVVIFSIIVSEQSYFKEITILDFNFWLVVINLLMFFWFMYKCVKSKIELKPIVEDFKCKFKWGEVIKVVCINVILSLSFACLALCLAYMISPEFCNKLLADTNENSSNTLSSLIFNCIGAVLLAPAVEECMFRGVILNRVKMKYGVFKAIILSSILFGIMHADLAFLGAFAFGIMMCLIYIKTENILITISIHAFNNFLVSLVQVISFFTSSSSGSSNISKSDIMLWLPISLVGFLVSGFFTVKYIKKNWPEKMQITESII